MKDREFTVGGIRHHLNDNPVRNGFEGRYRVLFWSEGNGRWQLLCTAGSRRDAMRAARVFWNGRRP